MMYDFSISKEQARQFAYDCFDVIIRDIKMMEEQSQGSSENTQQNVA
ncbi:MAG TPA: hypothetical protein IAB39_08200 [Candidatus Onthovicinus excrementipullorum]|nr:hypothetical protein [Candidatus Onthovicinus excrementipullorum]